MRGLQGLKGIEALSPPLWLWSPSAVAMRGLQGLQGSSLSPVCCCNAGPARADGHRGPQPPPLWLWSPSAAAMRGLRGLQGSSLSPSLAAMRGLQGLEGSLLSPIAAAMRGLEGSEALSGPGRRRMPSAPASWRTIPSYGGGPAPGTWRAGMRDHTIIRGGSGT